MTNTNIFDLLNQIPQCFEEPFITTGEEVDALISEYGLENLHTNHRILSPIADFEALWYKDTCIAIFGGLASNCFHSRVQASRERKSLN